ncbi:C1q-related factor-like [Haliotis cracherodii]|uniref:C1q-related factor-like n=1 Tax=Haliotis cracherodii TaxID=6455 RepID=UPI0039E7CAE6
MTMMRCLRVLVLCVVTVAAADPTTTPTPTTTATPVVNHIQNCYMDSETTNVLRLERALHALSTKVESVESQLRQSEERLSSMKSELSDKDAFFKNITRSLATQATDVAYEVSLSSDTNQPQETHLKFDHILYNQGDAYNKATGIFTAPVSGTYLFWAYVMSNGKPNMDVRIHKDKKLIGLGHTRLGSQYGVASITTATHLHGGDQVWMSIKGTGVVPLRGDGFSSYGGTIIRSN